MTEMSLVLNNFIKNLFTTKSSEYSYTASFDPTGNAQQSSLDGKQLSGVLTNVTEQSVLPSGE